MSFLKFDVGEFFVTMEDETHSFSPLKAFTHPDVFWPHEMAAHAVITHRENPHSVALVRWSPTGELVMYSGGWSAMDGIQPKRQWASRDAQPSAAATTQSMMFICNKIEATESVTIGRAKAYLKLLDGVIQVSHTLSLGREKWTLASEGESQLDRNRGMDPRIKLDMLMTLMGCTSRVLLFFSPTSEDDDRLSKQFQNLDEANHSKIRQRVESGSQLRAECTCEVFQATASMCPCILGVCHHLFGLNLSVLADPLDASDLKRGRGRPRKQNRYGAAPVGCLPLSDFVLPPEMRKYGQITISDDKFHRAIGEQLHLGNFRSRFVGMPVLAFWPLDEFGTSGAMYTVDNKGAWLGYGQVAVPPSGKSLSMCVDADLDYTIVFPATDGDARCESSFTYVQCMTGVVVATLFGFKPCEGRLPLAFERHVESSRNMTCRAYCDDLTVVGESPLVVTYSPPLQQPRVRAFISEREVGVCVIIVFYNPFRPAM